jgi:hypothetical protein
MAPRKKTVAAGIYRGERDARLGKKENTSGGRLRKSSATTLASLSSDTGVGNSRVF